MLNTFVYDDEIIEKDTEQSEDESDYFTDDAKYLYQHVQTAYQLGRIYSSEEGPIDMNKAINYFVIASQDQNSFAEYQLGKIYLYGNGVEKDYDTAMHYLHLSAEHRNQYAEQLLYSIQK